MGWGQGLWASSKTQNVITDLSMYMYSATKQESKFFLLVNLVQYKIINFGTHILNSE